MPTYLSPGVYVEEVEAGSRPIEGVGTAVAAFVGLAERGPFNTPTLISNWSQFTNTFGDFVEGSYLAHAVYGYILNGGANCYVVRIGEDGAARRTGASPRGRAKPKGIEGAPQAVVGGYRVTAIGAGAEPGQVSVEVVDPTVEAPAEDAFKLLVRVGGQVQEEYDNLTVAKGKQNAATIVNAASKLIRLEEAGAGAALERPANGTSTALTAPPEPAAVPSPRLSADDYVGDVSERTGFAGLEAIDEITMVAVPDLMSAYQQGAIDLETVQSGPGVPVIRTFGGQEHPLLGPQSPCRTAYRPAFSLDGTRVAVICPIPPGGSSYALFVIDLATGQATGPIRTGAHPVGDPTWTSDGHVIFLQRESKRGKKTLYSVDGNGDPATVRQLSTAPASRPDWCEGHGTLFIENTNGSKQPGPVALLTDQGSLSTLPFGNDVQSATWSPDCTQIALVRPDATSGVPSLFIVAADGSGTPTEIPLPGGAVANQPAWGVR